MNTILKKFGSSTKIVADDYFVIIQRNIYSNSNLYVSYHGYIYSKDRDQNFIPMEFNRKYKYIAKCNSLNSGNSLDRLNERLRWDKVFCKHIKKLTKPLIACGDFNISQTELDIKQPKRHYNKHPGHTQKEIDSFKKIKCGLVDVYRELYPEGEKFSFFSYLAKNYDRDIGYRCDLFLVSKIIKDKIIDTKIYNQSRGMKLSDHCLILLEMNLQQN